jgi:hypothetical protein
MAMCNYIECAQVLERGSYMKTGLHWHDQHEMGRVRFKCRQLQLRFSLAFKIIINGKPIHPQAIFRRSLVEFAAAVVAYKEEKHPDASRAGPGCDARAVKAKMCSLFEANFPHLLPCLLRLVDERVTDMQWTGPPLSIARRSQPSENREFFSFDDGFYFEPIEDLTAPTLEMGAPSVSAKTQDPSAVEQDVEMMDIEPEDGEKVIVPLPRRSGRSQPAKPPPPSTPTKAPASTTVPTTPKAAKRKMKKRARRA